MPKILELTIKTILCIFILYLVKDYSGSDPYKYTHVLLSYLVADSIYSKSWED